MILVFLSLDLFFYFFYMPMKYKLVHVQFCVMDFFFFFKEENLNYIKKRKLAIVN